MEQGYLGLLMLAASAIVLGKQSETIRGSFIHG